MITIKNNITLHLTVLFNNAGFSFFSKENKFVACFISMGILFQILAA